MEKMWELIKVKNKKALSQIVSTLVLIMLTVALIGGLAVVLKNFVGSQTKQAESCAKVGDQLTLNRDYTCYDGANNRTLVSINRGNLPGITYVLVAVTYGTTSQTFKITDTSQNLGNLTNYPDGTNNVSLPSDGGGKTYIVKGSSVPTQVVIAPNMGKQTCAASDSINQVPNC